MLPLTLVPHRTGTLLHLLLSTFLWAPAYYAKLWSLDTKAMVPQVAGTSLDKFGFMTGTGEHISIC